MEESKIVERVLECSFEPSSPHFVKAVVDQLTEAEAPSFNRADLIVEAKCGLLAPTSPNPQMRQLVYLHSCFLRADDFAKKSKGVTDEVKKKLPDLMRLLARYANLVLTMPELFSDPDGNGNMSVVAGSALLREIFCPGSTAATAPAGGGLGLTTGTAGGSSSSSTMGSGAPQGQRVFSLNFTHLLATTIVEELDPQDDAEQTVRNLFEPALDELMQRLKGRQFADHKMYDLGFFTSLMKTKGYLPRVVAKYSKQFLPEAQKSLYSTKIAPQGFVLQMESMIGSLLCPTTMDTLLYKESSVRKMHFEGATKKGHRTVQASQGTLRSTLGQVMEQALDVINPLLRAGDESREGVLKWLSEALKGNEPRAKGANQIHEGGDHQHFLDTLENSPLPIHQNLDMRLMMQLQNCRTHGYSTPGFGLNLFWLLLELNRPVKLSASGNVLDPAIFGSDAEAGKLLAALADDAKMGDEETVKLAKSSLRMANLDENGNEKKFKFATQVFSLLLKAFHVCLVPVVKEDMCFVSGFSHLWTKAPEKADPCFGEHLCIETIVQQEQFLSALVHGVNLLCLYLLTAAYPSCRSKVSERPDRPIDAFSGVAIPPKDVSPEWSVLPTVLIENLVAILEYFRDVQHPPTAQHAFYQRIDADILLLTLVFILGAGDHVKNPSTRGKVVNVISYLIKNAKFSNRLQEFLPVANNMIPSCINVFNAVEKTKQSYYDIRMQLKFQLRVPIMELFGMLIPKEEHKANLRRYALNYEEDFLKFLNLLMSDATLQLDEGMDTLAAIRKRAAKRAAGTAAAAPAGGDDLEELLATGTAGVGVDRGGIQDDERNEQGEDLYRRSRRDPKEHCVTYMKLGFRTIKTLHSITQEATEMITKKGLVLQQMIHNCLNACLDRLVGPKCMQLKGQSRDFEEYHFKPVELLSMICDMYSTIAAVEKDKVLHLIASDHRGYDANTFQKAARIVRREAMLPKEKAQAFEALVEELKSQAGAEDALANVDVPDEFMDPLMDELMVDPVVLPSGTTLNRPTAERICMSDGMDPYTRQPVTMADLKPNDELRERVLKFAKDNNIKITQLG